MPISQGPARKTGPTPSNSAAGIQFGGIWKRMQGKVGPMREEEQQEVTQRDKGVGRVGCDKS